MSGIFRLNANARQSPVNSYLPTDYGPVEDYGPTEPKKEIHAVMERYFS